MTPGFRNTLMVLLGMAAISFLIASPVVLAQDAKQEEKPEVKKGEKITLKDGMAKLDSALKGDDEKDKVQKQPCKVITVELKKNHSYKIDMTAKEIDSYLRVENADGKELAKDDDSGGFQHARIHFYCPMDGATASSPLAYIRHRTVYPDHSGNRAGQGPGIGPEGWGGQGRGQTRRHGHKGCGASALPVQNLRHQIGQGEIVSDRHDEQGRRFFSAHRRLERQRIGQR